MNISRVTVEGRPAMMAPMANGAVKFLFDDGDVRIAFPSVAPKFGKLHKSHPQQTKVEAYLAKRQSRLASALRGVMEDWAHKAARQVARRVGKLAKSEQDDEVQRILDALALEGYSVDLVDELTPEMVSAFEEGGVTGMIEVKFETTPEITDQMDALAKKYAEERGAELVKDFAGTTEDVLRGVIADGVERGMGVGEMSDAIMESGAFGAGRADMIARTELAFAHVQGNVEGWRQSGEVDKKEWLTAEGCCELCAEMNGVQVDIDGSFDFDGDAIDGPPGHPNCRCDCLPVLKEEATTIQEGESDE